MVRASNTQPVLVMRFEATTLELLQEYRNEIDGRGGSWKTSRAEAWPEVFHYRGNY